MSASQLHLQPTGCYRRRALRWRGGSSSWDMMHSLIVFTSSRKAVRWVPWTLSISCALHMICKLTTLAAVQISNASVMLCAHGRACPEVSITPGCRCSAGCRASKQASHQLSLSKRMVPGVLVHFHRASAFSRIFTGRYAYYQIELH